MKVIITGSTGMVGKGVLLECLEHDKIESVLVINRSAIDIKHPKLTEIIHTDFKDYTEILNQLSGYHACFFCLGVSAVGMSEQKYYQITYEYTLALANQLLEVNQNMIFNYVSGTGTDSSEKGRSMWARVKGKTENELLKLPFKNALMFRPGLIVPKKNIKSKTPFYNFIYTILKPILPLLEKWFPGSITTTTKVGIAMINSVIHPFDKVHLENNDINELAKMTYEKN